MKLDWINVALLIAVLLSWLWMVAEWLGLMGFVGRAG